MGPHSTDSSMSEIGLNTIENDKIDVSNQRSYSPSTHTDPYLPQTWQLVLPRIEKEMETLLAKYRHASTPPI